MENVWDIVEEFSSVTNRVVGRFPNGLWINFLLFRQTRFASFRQCCTDLSLEMPLRDSFSGFSLEILRKKGLEEITE